MGTAQLVTGPVDTSQLGFVLMHEHILMRDHNVIVNYPHLFDREARLAEAVNRLSGLKQRGIGTVIDLTTVDLGRDIRFIEDAAKGSGINVIACTGMWWQPPAFFFLRGIDVLIDCFRRDINDGISGTSVKAGIIKMAVHTPGVTAPIEMALRAGARIHRETGVPIATHTDALEHRGDDQQKVFLDEGVDLTHTIIGHSGDTTDMDYLKRLMERGSSLGMDRFGLDFAGPEKLASFSERVAHRGRALQGGLLGAHAPFARRLLLLGDGSAGLGCA